MRDTSYAGDFYNEQMFLLRYTIHWLLLIHFLLDIYFAVKLRPLFTLSTSSLDLRAPSSVIRTPYHRQDDGLNAYLLFIFEMLCLIWISLIQTFYYYTAAILTCCNSTPSPLISTRGKLWNIKCTCKYFVRASHHIVFNTRSLWYYECPCLLYHNHIRTQRKYVAANPMPNDFRIAVDFSCHLAFESVIFDGI